MAVVSMPLQPLFFLIRLPTVGSVYLDRVTGWNVVATGIAFGLARASLERSAPMVELSAETHTAYTAVLTALRWLGFPGDLRVLLALEDADSAASGLEDPHKGVVHGLLAEISACHEHGVASSPGLLRAFRAASQLLSGKPPTGAGVVLDTRTPQIEESPFSGYRQRPEHGAGAELTTGLER
jgi:hypothetical protein